MKEPSTLKRRLCVRTYNVIPLSQRSGIVEWCEGTLPLGDYLIGSPQNPHVGAHARYRPADWTSIECRKKLLQAGTSKARVYSDICSHFKPVFHHFFMEKFTSPPQWFERRLTYTRSVAASSIGERERERVRRRERAVKISIIFLTLVGYIVGLGDRHVQNILIDTNSAELIHIDLGKLHPFIEIILKCLCSNNFFYSQELRLSRGRRFLRQRLSPFVSPVTWSMGWVWLEWRECSGSAVRRRWS